MQAIRRIDQANITAGTRVFVRADLDEVIDFESDNILDDFRLKCSLDTLTYLKTKNARIILGGHVGRPGGKYVKNLSTKRFIQYYEKALDYSNFEMLENLRFDPREEQLSLAYAKELAGLAQIYVNESFAASHRKHTSVYLLPSLLPAYGGFRLLNEVQVLQELMQAPKQPFTAIVGGIKSETKLPLIKRLLNLSTQVLVGSGLGPKWVDPVPSNLVLPLDYATAQKDIGPKTIAKYQDIIHESKTILVAGPVGMYTHPDYEQGTREIFQAITTTRCHAVAGGGDTLDAIKKYKCFDAFNFVSTGGGAMLSFIAEGTLPGLEALKKHA